MTMTFCGKQQQQIWMKKMKEILFHNKLSVVLRLYVCCARVILCFDSHSVLRIVHWDVKHRTKAIIIIMIVGYV